jgi:hypothetical protein
MTDTIDCSTAATDEFDWFKITGNGDPCSICSSESSEDVGVHVGLAKRSPTC